MRDRFFDWGYARTQTEAAPLPAYIGSPEQSTFPSRSNSGPPGFNEGTYRSDLDMRIITKAISPYEILEATPEA